MNEINLHEIGKRIQKRRKQLGMTQETLSDKMNVSIQMVSNLERGVKSIRIENLVNLCQILEISTDYILSGKETTDDFSATASRLEQLPPNSRKMIEMLIDYCLQESDECV